MIRWSTPTTRDFVDVSQFAITRIQGHATTTRTPQRPSRLPLVAILYLALSLNDHLRVPLSPSAHLAPGPCPLERNRSSPNHNHVYSSLSAHLRPLPCPLEHDCSPSVSTMSIRTQTFVSHPDRVHSSAATYLPPRLYLFECEHSSPTLTMSIREQPLIFHHDHLNPSPNTHLPP